jgi:hypothetical protein
MNFSRCWFDPHWFRRNSYFRMGNDWVKAALENGWQLMRWVQFIRDRDPAIASRKQRGQCIYRIKFKIDTHGYSEFHSGEVHRDDFPCPFSNGSTE